MMTKKTRRRTDMSCLGTTSRCCLADASGIDVACMGIKYKGKLVRTILICATVRGDDKRGWAQGPTRAYVNGKRVPLVEGQKLIGKVRKKAVKK